MIRRLIFALILTLFISLGLQGDWTTRAYAKTIQMVKGSLVAVSAHVSISFPDSASAIKPSEVLDIRTHPTAPGSVRTIFPSSAPLDVKIVQAADLTITGPDQVNLTKPIILSGFLRVSSTGAGIANKTVTFSTGATYLGRTHTDDQGIFIIKINKDLPAGKYLVTATFKGAHLLAPSSGVIWVEVLPATVRVQTVPAIAGITFQMDGRQFVSAADGFATIKIGQMGNYRLDVLLDQYHDPSRQVEFGRWSEEIYKPSRSVKVPDDKVIQVGLDVFHKISFKFIDLDGFPVDPARISAISIRSVQGDVFTLTPGDTPWLPASRTARRQNGLEETDLLYSVNSVTIDGSNVVNSAQQRFFAKSDDTWPISLLLYSLHISIKDALFAAPVGTSVSIVFPNGQVKDYPLDKSGVLEIHALARGIYRISIAGVKGLGTSTPVALSRNQVVSLKIMTQLDLTVIGLIGAGFAVGIIFYGRPWLLQVMLRRKRPSTSKIRWTSMHEN